MSVETNNAPRVPAPLQAFGRYVRWFCWGCCVLLAALMLLQILLRTATSVSISWTDEMMKIVFTWLGLLTTVTAMWDNGHIAVDSIVRWLPAKIRRAAIILEHCLTFGLMLILIPFMWDLVLTAHGQKTLAMDLPMEVLYAAFPLCFALLAVDRAFALYCVIRSGGQP